MVIGLEVWKLRVVDELRTDAKLELEKKVISKVQRLRRKENCKGVNLEAIVSQVDGSCWCP